MFKKKKDWQSFLNDCKWVNDVIKSCKTPEHLENAFKLIVFLTSKHVNQSAKMDLYVGRLLEYWRLRYLSVI